MVVCIGDQKVCPSLNFTGVKAYFQAALGYQEHTDIDYNGVAEINHDLNFPTHKGKRQNAKQFDRRIVPDGPKMQGQPFPVTKSRAEKKQRAPKPPVQNNSPIYRAWLAANPSGETA